MLAGHNVQPNKQPKSQLNKQQTPLPKESPNHNHDKPACKR